jgi:hypothetical protein
MVLLIQAVWWLTVTAFLTNIQWIQKHIFFHVVDVTILKSLIICKTYGGTLAHVVFSQWFVDLIHAAQDINLYPLMSSHGQPSLQAVCIVALDFKYWNHWPTKCHPQKCHICSDKSKAWRSVYQCGGHNSGLCGCPHFNPYHTELIYRKLCLKHDVFHLSLCMCDISVVILKTVIYWLSEQEHTWEQDCLGMWCKVRGNRNRFCSTSEKRLHHCATKECCIVASSTHLGRWIFIFVKLFVRAYFSLVF